jgi:hypothetical protein
VTSESPAGHPAWRDSITALVVLVAGAVMWGFFAVLTLARGAYGLGALNALLFTASAWAISRNLQRRQRRGR